jgi:hypothetical protein
MNEFFNFWMHSVAVVAAAASVFFDVPLDDVWLDIDNSHRRLAASYHFYFDFGKLYVGIASSHS